MDTLILPPKQKPRLKREFWTKQKHHTKDYWNYQRVMFLIFLIFDFQRVFLVLAVFSLFRDGLIISTLRFFSGHI